MAATCIGKGYRIFRKAKEARGMRVDFMSGSFKAQISSRGFNDGIISKLYSI